MKPHTKKMLTPIIVTFITVLYYVVYFGFLFVYLEGALKYLFGFLPLIFAAVTIAVCVERINEIKKGEEDDLSKY